MLWSRLWMALLALVGAVAVLLVVTLPRPLGDTLDQEVSGRLARAQQATALLLKVNARQWMDTAAHDATDAVLVDALEQATHGATDLTIIHKTVQERLRVFAEKTRVDLLIATDGRGRVIARAGADEAVYKDGVEGLPLVADALRGLRGDDTWSLDGKLYRVAASPVIGPGRYAGVLVMGQEVGAELAQSLRQMLGVEVAFLLRGRVIAASTPLPVAQQLPLVANDHAAELRDGGRAPLVALGEGDARYLAVLAPFVGESQGHQAAYALLAARPPLAGLGTLFGKFSPNDLAAVPLTTLAPVLGGLLLAIGIGLLFSWLEGTRPIWRLVRQSQALARGETARLDDAQRAGPLGAIARAVNTTLDRLGAHVRIPSSHSEPSRARLSSNEVEQRPRGSSSEADPSVPIVVERPKAPPRLRLDRRDTQIDPGMPILDEPSSPTLARPPIVEAPSPAHRRAERLAILPSSDLRGEPNASGPDYVDAPHLPPPLSSGTVPPFSATPLPPPLSAGRDDTDVGDAVLRAVLAREASEHDRTEDHDLDDELRAVFHEFLETKQRLGEPTDGVTFDKFAVKLKANRDQLISRYACKQVKFQVYVKDGKAALKATPES
jgi:hypothetical protein